MQENHNHLIGVSKKNTTNSNRSARAELTLLSATRQYCTHTILVCVNEMWLVVLGIHDVALQSLPHANITT